MNGDSLRADCQRCAALCCIAFAFEVSADFGVDKAAEEPCPHLNGCGRCGIYDHRLDRGFGGCLRYECFGAGQRVVQQTFAGVTWMDDGAVMGPMLRAFDVVRRVHERLALLRAAEAAELTGEDRRELERLFTALDGIAETALDTDAQARFRRIDEEARIFLAGLRRYFDADRRRLPPGGGAARPSR